MRLSHGELVQMEAAAPIEVIWRIQIYNATKRDFLSPVIEDPKPHTVRIFNVRENALDVWNALVEEMPMSMVNHKGEIMLTTMHLDEMYHDKKYKAMWNKTFGLHKYADNFILR